MRVVRRFYRQVFALFVGASSIAVPIAVTQFGGGAVAPAAASGFDTITYVQTSGAKGTYLQFNSADGSTTINQSITSGGGGCSNPTVKSSTPLLLFSANEYPNGYTNPPAAAGTASVGAYQQRTGVCFTPQAWSIENNEGLDFQVGTTPTYVAGRVFVRAQLYLERWADKTGLPNVTAQLAEWLGGTQVGQQDCTLGAAGSITLVDTNITSGNGSCTADNGFPNDPTTTGFDTIEVRETTPGGSISVVGPTSSFSLANQLCPPKDLKWNSADGTTTTGQVSVDLTMTGTNGQCKSYTYYAALANDPQQLTLPDGSQVSTTKSVTFDTFPSSGSTSVPFTVVVDWGLFTDCTPEQCQPTYISFDGTTYSSETYCSPQLEQTDAIPLCVASKTYSYVNVGGIDYTDIQETWYGYKDWLLRP